MLPLQLLSTYSPHGLVFLHFRKMVLQYELWDQIRTDHGKEWKLFLFVNDSLSHLRNTALNHHNCNLPRDRYKNQELFSVLD